MNISIASVLLTSTPMDLTRTKQYSCQRWGQMKKRDIVVLNLPPRTISIPWVLLTSALMDLTLTGAIRMSAAKTDKKRETLWC